MTSKAKILVIDDEAGIRESLRAVLEDEGYRVLLAEDGITGLEEAERERPDAVLLDIWLPGMDGMECLQRIRATLPETPVIMISGHGSVEAAVRATKLGAYDFIEKPLSLDQVLLRLRHALQAVTVIQERDQLRGLLQSQAGSLNAIGDDARLEEAQRQFERELIRIRLEAHDGDRRRTAASLGISREELDARLEALDS